MHFNNVLFTVFILWITVYISAYNTAKIRVDEEQLVSLKAINHINQLFNFA